MRLKWIEFFILRGTNLGTSFKVISGSLCDDEKSLREQQQQQKCLLAKWTFSKQFVVFRRIWLTLVPKIFFRQYSEFHYRLREVPLNLFHFPKRAILLLLLVFFYSHPIVAARILVRRRRRRSSLGSRTIVRWSFWWSAVKRSTDPSWWGRAVLMGGGHYRSFMTTKRPST